MRLEVTGLNDKDQYTKNTERQRLIRIL